MTKLTLNTDITLSTEQLISAIAQLNTNEIETLFTSIGELLKQRQQDASVGPLPSLTQRTDADLDLPVVEALIPRSITLDGGDVSF